jgi:hypothetical protein
MKHLIPVMVALSLSLSMFGCRESLAAKPKDAGSAPEAAITPAKKAQIKNGERIVNLGGCNDCHTPKNFDPELKLPIPDMKRMLSGHPANDPPPKSELAAGDMAVINGGLTSFKLQMGTVFTANLTPDRETGLGAWDEQMFISALRTGKHAGVGRPILPPMPWFEIGHASDEDLKAIFAYLQSIPPVRNQVPNPTVPLEALNDLQKSYELLLKRMKGSPPAASGR